MDEHSWSGERGGGKGGDGGTEAFKKPYFAICAPLLFPVAQWIAPLFWCSCFSVFWGRVPLES